MFQENLDARSLLAWAAAGLAAPIAGFFGSLPWYLPLLSALAAGLIWCLAWSRGQASLGKLTAIGQYVFLTVAAAAAAWASKGAWRGGDLAIPIGLLLLSAWAGSHGADGCRYGPVVFLLSCFLYGVVLIFALPDAEPGYMLPAFSWGQGEAFGILLLPGVLAYLPVGEEKRPVPWALGLGLFGGAVAFVTGACLSPQVAGSTENAFFRMVQGVRILGVAERFEAVISAGMTMGWFCLLSLLLSLAGRMTETVFPGKGRLGVWLSAALAGVGMLWTEKIPAFVMAALACFFWGLLPLLAPRKNFEKSKKPVDKNMPT